MQQRRQREQADNQRAKLAGNMLMGAGVVTPILGVICTRFVSLEFDTYRHVIQGIFIAGLLLFIGGILVRNYWTGNKTAALHDPQGYWSTAAPEKSFDWTGVGCSLFVLGPGLFFIVGMLSVQDFNYAPIVGFVSMVLCVMVGSKFFRLGRVTRAMQAAEKNASLGAVAHDDTDDDTDGIVNADQPQIIPGRRGDKYVLVEDAGTLGCGIAFFGIFTAVWYGATFLFIFLVLNSGGEDTGTPLLILALFLLAGLIPLSMLIRALRMVGAFEKHAEFLLPHWPLVEGEKVELAFECRLKKELTAMSMNIELEYEKVDRSGSETTTTKLDTRTVTVRDLRQQGRAVTGTWQMDMPSDWALPYKTEKKEINWGIRVTVELAEGPKGFFYYQLRVVPERAIDNPAENETTAFAESEEAGFESPQALADPDRQI